MARLTAFAVSTVMAIALSLPAVAQTDTQIPLDDDHLYIGKSSVRKSQELTTRSPGIGGLVGTATYRSGTTSNTNISVYRGALPISDARFLDILEASRIAPEFTRTARGRQAWSYVGPLTLDLGLVALGCGLIIGAGFLPDVSIGNIALKQFVYPILGASLAGTGITLLPIHLMEVQRPFNLDEAADAIKAYNANLDSMRPVKPRT